MAQFKAFSAGVEVNGETVLSVVSGMGSMKTMALGFLEEQGIKDPKPGQWFEQQAWLNAFKKIGDSVGANTLYAIGQKIPESAQFPSDIDTIGKALSAIDVAYHINHRGGEIGHYNFEAEEPDRATLECANPYPCEFDFGIVSAMTKRFAPKDRNVVVTHDDTKPCRKKGDDSCTYHVEW